MRVPLPDWTALGLFAGIVLTVTLYGLAVSAHFPSESRTPSLRGTIGQSILWGTATITAAAALQALRFALSDLPVYAAVIAGGAAVLAAPMVLKPFPDTLIDDRTGLVLFAALAALLAMASTQL